MADPRRIEMDATYTAVAPPNQELMWVVVADWTRLIERLKRCRDLRTPWLLSVGVALLGFGGAAFLALFNLSGVPRTIAITLTAVTLALGLAFVWFSGRENQYFGESIDSVITEMSDRLAGHEELMKRVAAADGEDPIEWGTLLKESWRSLDLPSTGPPDPDA